MIVREPSDTVVRPTEKDFVLNVISRGPNSDNRPLKKYAIEGNDLVGVEDGEAFEVHFENLSREDAQVRISINGTDTLTGKPAHLEANSNMWIVRAGRTLHLKAWSENNEGGSRFVFTGGEKSVVFNTGGDLAHNGVIAAAVFIERDAPKVYQAPMRYATKGMSTNSFRSTYSANASFNLGENSTKGGQHVNKTLGRRSVSTEESFDMVDRERAPSAAPASASATPETFKTAASVGAGEYVEQKTKTVKGLDAPVLNCVVRVKYEWWTDLQEKIKNVKPAEKPPTLGFPDNKTKTNFDFSNLPKTISTSARTEVKDAVVSYPRFI